jgi:hypothetical protein
MDNKKEKKLSPYKIGIRFSDNDFGITIKSFLEIYYNARKSWYLDEEEVDKKSIVEIFNKSAHGIYWVCQNRLIYQPEWDAAKYIQIEEKSVFFDKEVDEYIEKVDGWDNCEFFILDLYSGDVSSI